MGAGALGEGVGAGAVPVALGAGMAAAGGDVTEFCWASAAAANAIIAQAAHAARARVKLRTIP